MNLSTIKPFGASVLTEEPMYTMPVALTSGDVAQLLSLMTPDQAGAAFAAWMDMRAWLTQQAQRLEIN